MNQHRYSNAGWFACTICTLLIASVEGSCAAGAAAHDIKLPAEMVKIQHAYGAPIDDAEIKFLGIYLASNYGDATTVKPADMTLASSSVLDGNACLSCHALQQKVVGPAYHEVAIKYAGDPQTRSKLEANIRAGGAGKWGTVPMPPFPNLTTAELQSLADFVLKQ